LGSITIPVKFSGSVEEFGVFKEAETRRIGATIRCAIDCFRNDFLTTGITLHELN